MDLTKFIVSRDDATVNGRIKYLPDENGIYKPYELTCFERAVFVKPGYEITKARRPKYGSFFCTEELFEEAEQSVSNQAENKRKSFCRAKNKLFDILLCTLSFDCFVTLTISSEQLPRYDYAAVVKKLGQWLDNRVRRNGLVYALVPELHKDGAIHFHGLMNKEVLKLDRALNPYNGLPLYDDSGREIYNIRDYPFGFTTVIPLSGDNARIATAKYCYKYITKSGGDKVGGRYYLSGGAVGRPRYEYVICDYDMLDAKEMKVGGCMNFKKQRL